MVAADPPGALENGPLGLVKEFVNTHDVDDGTDELSTPADLSTWFRQNGFGKVNADEEDVRRAARIREALRGLLLANNGDPLDASAVEALNREAESITLAVRFGPDGLSQLEPVCDPCDAVLGRILAIVHDAMADSSWRRLKACHAHTCEVAFIDRSKNNSRTWCDMAVCGNRTKARKYRSKRRDT
jgi:predicted RNA-binding Zn ribbon-like protein